MNILIKGMEMPKPGRYEAVIIVLDKSTAEIAISPAEDDIGYWKEYPLVPVPPHGRLIDADALKDVQQADADFFKGSSDYGEKCRYDEAINAVANIVNAPTIIPAEEGE